MVVFILLILSPMIIVPQKEVLYTAIEAAGNAIVRLETQKQFAEIQEKIIEQLITKYGDGSFEIISMKDENERDYFIEQITVKTSYMNENFTVNAYLNDGEILQDNFLEVYAKEKWGVENIKEFALEKAIEKEEKKIPKGYDIRFNFENSYFYEYNEYLKGRVPTIEDYIEMVEIRVDNDVIVGNSYTQKDLEKFSKHICDICRIYIENYARDEWDKTVWFEFENGISPYRKAEEDKLGAYKAGGYVKEAGSIYLLYLNPSPYKINK